MRCFLLLFYLIIPSYVFTQSSSLKKQLTLEISNVRYEEVLRQIESQTGCHFSYEGELFKNETPIDIKVKNKSLEFVLKKLFSSQYDFGIIINSIVIKKSIHYIPRSKAKREALPPTKNTLATDKERKTLLKAEQLSPIQKIEIKQLALSNKPVTLSINSYGPYDSIVNIPKEKRTIKIGYSIAPFIDINKPENKKPGIGTSISMDINLFKNLAFSTGLSYFYQTIENSQFDINQLSNTEIKYPSEAFSRDYNAEMHFFDWNFLLRYSKTIKNTHLFISSGIANTYVDIRYDYYYNQNKVKYGRYYKAGYTNLLLASIGVERKFKLEKKLSFQLEPFIKYSIDEYSPEKLSPILLGVSLRLNYFINN